MNSTPWTARRKISFVFHALYALLTIGIGAASALLLWQQWFDSWWVASVIISVIEVLCILSLILHIARIEWPLSDLRHVLPFLAIVPLGVELHTLMAANPLNSGFTTFAIPGVLTIWFIWLEVKILASLEGLFISPTEAAKEHAVAEMGRIGVSLTRYQTLRDEAERFASTVLPPKPIQSSLIPTRPFSSVSLQLEDTLPTIAMSVSPEADPRFRKVVSLAAQKFSDGSWAYTKDSIHEQTRADPGLVDLVCKMVRSGTLIVESTKELT